MFLQLYNYNFLLVVLYFYMCSVFLASFLLLLVPTYKNFAMLLLLHVFISKVLMALVCWLRVESQSSIRLNDFDITCEAMTIKVSVDFPDL